MKKTVTFNWVIPPGIFCRQTDGLPAEIDDIECAQLRHIDSSSYESDLYSCDFYETSVFEESSNNIIKCPQCKLDFIYGGKMKETRTATPNKGEINA